MSAKRPSGSFYPENMDIFIPVKIDIFKPLLTANEQVIASRSMINGLTSKNPVKMKVRTLSAFYVRIRKRRAQTEARVAILTNDFAGTPMRSKGFKRREVEMSWHILTHNLWVLARMEKSEQITQPILKETAA
jgi:hypothetical protein